MESNIHTSAFVRLVRLLLVSLIAMTSAAAAVLADDTLSGVAINASLHRQVGVTQMPTQLASVKSDVLSVRLTIKNNRAEPIVFVPTSLRLRTNRHTMLTPDSARAVAQRMLRDAGSDSAVAANILLGPLWGQLVSMSEADAKNEAVEMATGQLRRAQLRHQTIAPSRSASGMVYFIATGMDGELDNPELRVHITDPSHRKNYETSLDMTSGSATASTLLLAGLKQPRDVASDAEEFTATLAALKASFERGELSDEEYMQKQRAIVNEYTGNARAGSGIGASSKPEYLRLAVLPFAAKFPNWTSAMYIEGELERFSRAFSGRRSGLKLTYSHYQPELGGGPELDPGSLWDGYIQKLPRKREIYAVAGKLDADVALTFFHALRTADAYNYESYSVDVYLFDLAYERMYHGSGDERHYKKVTERLFEQLIGDRKRSTRRVTTAGPLRVGVLPPGQSKPSWSRSHAMEEEIYNEIRRFIQSKQSFTVSIDYAAKHELGLSDSYAVWQGTAVRRVPDKTKMQVIGEKLGVDILVLAWIDLNMIGAEIDLYVFEVVSGRMHQSSGNSTRAKGLVESTFALANVHNEGKAVLQ
jgi:hypothetical protein